jgi:hypothetical protein
MYSFHWRSFSSGTHSRHKEIGFAEGWSILDSSLLRNVVGMMDLISQTTRLHGARKSLHPGGLKTGNLWDDFCLNNEGKFGLYF